MITSHKTPFLSEIEAGNVRIPPHKLAYFQARLRNNIYDFVVEKFLENERRGEITKALIGKRLGTDPARISRLLGAPGNWTLNTISDLLLGIAAEELKLDSVPLFNRESRNYREPDWLSRVTQVASQVNQADSQTTPRSVFSAADSAAFDSLQPGANEAPPGPANPLARLALSSQPGEQHAA